MAKKLIKWAKKITGCKVIKEDKRICFSGWTHPFKKDTTLGYLYALPLQEDNTSLRAWEEPIVVTKKKNKEEEFKKALSKIQKECDYYELHGKWSDAK